MSAPGCIKDILSSWGLGEIYPHDLTEPSLPPTASPRKSHHSVNTFRGSAGRHSPSTELVLPGFLAYRPETITAVSSSCVVLRGPKFSAPR